MAGGGVASRVAVALLVALVGCRGDAPFECFSHDACQTDGAGFCEPEGYCSVVDLECESGRRYASTAPASVAGMCVPPTEPVATEDDDGLPPDTGGDSSTADDTSTTTGDTSTSSSSDDATTESSTGLSDDGTTTGSTSTSSGSEGSSSTGDGIPDACQEPLEPAKCLGCIQNSCCAALVSCENSAACSAFLDCWTHGSAQCSQYDGTCCGTLHNPLGVGACMNSSCSATCPY